MVLCQSSQIFPDAAQRHFDARLTGAIRSACRWHAVQAPRSPYYGEPLPLVLSEVLLTFLQTRLLGFEPRTVEAAFAELMRRQDDVCKGGPQLLLVRQMISPRCFLKPTSIFHLKGHPFPRLACLAMT